MSQEIQKFDPSLLMEGVRDRIKATFVSLIPDDQWKKMIENEIKKFMQEGQWQSDKGQFWKVVEEVLRAESREKIKTYLEKYHSTLWDGEGKMKTNEELNKLIIDNAPQIFAAMFASMFQQAVFNMKNSNY